LRIVSSRQAGEKKPQLATRLGLFDAAPAEAGPEHVIGHSGGQREGAALAGLAAALTSVQQVPVSLSAS
jgi:hypothetical protein